MAMEIRNCAKNEFSALNEHGLGIGEMIKIGVASCRSRPDGGQFF
jgi:hypothetical protein